MKKKNPESLPIELQDGEEILATDAAENIFYSTGDCPIYVNPAWLEVSGGQS